MSYHGYLNTLRKAERESRFFQWLLRIGIKIYNRFEPFPIERRKLVRIIIEAFPEESRDAYVFRLETCIIQDITCFYYDAQTNSCERTRIRETGIPWQPGNCEPSEAEIAQLKLYPEEQP